MIVSGGADWTVRIWDAGTGQPIGDPLTGHTGEVKAVAVGRAGGREVIVSGGDDRTVRIWDTNGPAAVIVDVLAPVRAIELSRTGRLCAATGRALSTFTTNS